jgi:UDP-N-acetylmuramoyl-tripeptide--D-alanyl-D-alanine ligase
MKAALLAFEAIDTKAKKIVVLGDMLELGINSPFWHRQLGRFLRKVPSVSHVILIGSMVQWTKKTLPVNFSVEHVPNWQIAIEKLHESLKDESAILVKGSLGMGLRNLVDFFAPQ